MLIYFKLNRHYSCNIIYTLEEKEVAETFLALTWDCMRYCFPLIIFIIGKAIPLQAWIGPEISRRLRLSDFKTIGTRRW
jgi:hypothetical protein